MTATLSKIKTSAAGLKAFFKISDLWRLRVEEQKNLLGLDSDSTLHKWKKDPKSARLDKDKLDRLSYLLGIYKDLQILLSDKESADSWVRHPNQSPVFGGRSALDVMCQGHIINLHQVREYLARARGI